MPETPQIHPFSTSGQKITPDSLLADNRSPRAVKRRQEFSQAEADGELNAVHRCSDSRYILEPTHIAIPTISAGGKKEPYIGIYNNPGIKNIVILPHVPCGGLQVKAQQAKEGVPNNIKDIATYVDEEIYHHDPIVQAVRSAMDVSRLTEKDVFVAIHTQENGINHPISATYRNGKAVFNGREIPKDFEVFLVKNEVFVAEVAAEFPDLKEMQQTQNPHFLVVSRSVRPAESEFPETTRRPGSTFRILIPMPEYEFINPSAARRVVDQANYPITQFTNLSRMLIETDNMDTSSWMFGQFIKRSWMKKWMQDPEHKVYIGKSIEGELLDIEEIAA